MDLWTKLRWVAPVHTNVWREASQMVQHLAPYVAMQVLDICIYWITAANLQVHLNSPAHLHKLLRINFKKWKKWKLGKALVYPSLLWHEGPQVPADVPLSRQPLEPSNVLTSAPKKSKLRKTVIILFYRTHGRNQPIARPAQVDLPQHHSNLTQGKWKSMRNVRPMMFYVHGYEVYCNNAVCMPSNSWSKLYLFPTHQKTKMDEHLTSTRLLDFLASTKTLESTAQLHEARSGLHKMRKPVFSSFEQSH